TSPMAKLAMALPVAYFVAGIGLVPHAVVERQLLITLAVKEAAIGVLLGFLWSMPFHVVQNIGHIIDYQTGLTFTQTIDPFSGNQSSVTANFISQVCVTAFIALGGYHIFLDSLFVSYKIWPLDAGVPKFDTSVLNIVLFESQTLFSLALVFAAPIIIALLLVEYCLGLVNKTAPMFHVMEIAQSVKGWIAVVLLVILMPYVLQRLITLIPSLGGMIRRVYGS
ncbi:MAG: EscT/YscT/HrcT family type III secretion system export apparatus protein, partial [Casimicrobium sp.]